MSGTLADAHRDAIKAIFSELLAAGVEDEGRWVHLIQIVNEAGRFVYGYPHLESSESDIFGALDDIATQLEGTKSAIEQTSREARIAQHELHKALEPLLPVEDDEPDPEPEERRMPVTPVAPSPETEQVSAPAASTPPVAVPSPVEEPPSRVDRGAEKPRARQGPRYDRDAMFAAIRATPNLAAAARELGLGSSAVLYSRLDTLQGHGELPADIAAKRPSVNGAMVTPRLMDRADQRIFDARDAETQRVREVAAEIKSRESEVMSKNVAEMDEFMARRKANAAEQADRSWKARNA